ncbi:hypothetical protein ANTQUA_LOCUS149 [Anthophora quadrimaculata]
MFCMLIRYQPRRTFTKSGMKDETKRRRKGANETNDRSDAGQGVHCMLSGCVTEITIASCALRDNEKKKKKKKKRRTKERLEASSSGSPPIDRGSTPNNDCSLLSFSSQDPASIVSSILL